MPILAQPSLTKLAEILNLLAQAERACQEWEFAMQESGIAIPELVTKRTEAQQKLRVLARDAGTYLAALSP